MSLDSVIHEGVKRGEANPPIDTDKMALEAGFDLFVPLPMIGAFDGDATHCSGTITMQAELTLSKLLK